MDIRKLQRAIVDGLEDVKAQHIAVFNTEHLSSMFERVIIASGTSNRQTKALAASVRDAVKGRGMQVMSTEGEDNGEWIIVDCGAAVAHIMQPAIREYYHLEEIWGGKAVRLKLGEVNTKLVKASEPEPEAQAAPSRKASKAKPPRPPVKKPAVHTTAGKTAVKKAANKSAAYKRVGAKRPAAKAAMAKTSAAKKAPTRRAPRPA
jgi:ribosome-associated protein